MKRKRKLSVEWAKIVTVFFYSARILFHSLRTKSGRLKKHLFLLFVVFSIDTRTHTHIQHEIPFLNKGVCTGPFISCLSLIGSFTYLICNFIRTHSPPSSGKDTVLSSLFRREMTFSSYPHTSNCRVFSIAHWQACVDFSAFVMALHNLPESVCQCE